MDLAVKRKYIPENPAAAVKHFNELRERPNRRMLTVEEELRILEAAPPHLRVAIILLSQTGGRTYSEGFSLRWDQVDFDNKLIRLNNNVKTPGSAKPIPLAKNIQNMPARYRAQFSQWRNVSALDTYGNTGTWVNGINSGQLGFVSSGYPRPCISRWC